MSGLKEKATTIWTELLEGLRADGLIANAIQQSGAATTAVIVGLAKTITENDGEQRAPWLSLSMVPQPGREVVAIDFTGKLHVIHFDADSNGWLWNGSHVDPARFVKYTFVSTEGALS